MSDEEKQEEIEEVFYALIDDTDEAVTDGATTRDAILWAVSVALVNANNATEDEPDYEPVDHEAALMSEYTASCEATLD